MTERAAGGTWRDVSAEQYRRLTGVSTLLGAIVFAFGLYLIFHRQVVAGLLLIAVGTTGGLWTVALRIDGTPGPLHKSDRKQPDEVWAPRVLHFYTRKDCLLCQEARARLDIDLEAKHITIVEHDVDNDPVLQKRYGDRVPVAVFRGGEVFALGYDVSAVRAL